MADKQNQALSKLKRDLEIAYHHGDEREMKDVLQSIFNVEDVDLYSQVLAICRESSSSLYSRGKSIQAITLCEFKDWAKKHDHLVLTRDHKDDAMFYLVSSGLMFIDQLKDVYQLDKGTDRAYLAVHLAYLYDSKNDPKTAASVAVKLKLQDYIDPEALLLPLMVVDKFQVAEEVLKDSPKLQRGYAEMLNKFCSLPEDQIFDYIQNKKRLQIIDTNKFRAKTLQKIAEKFIKKYDLDSAMFPSVYREKNLRSVRHVLNNRYRSPPIEHAKWDGNLEAAVAKDAWLQEKLILMITYEHHDARNAARWARKFNMPEDSLPGSVRRQLEESLESSFQSSAQIPPLIDMDDDYYDEFDDGDDGFMFASDDITYDEALETTNTEKKSKVADQYWSHPLLEDKIKFVNTCEHLCDCIKIVFKPGNVIGFDSEWQPAYGRAGQKDKIAIIQLAVLEQVFIVDVIEFDRTEEGQKLLQLLFRQLFTSENTLRIGFGIDSDISIIVQNYPYAQEFLDDAQNFEDLQNISSQIMKHPHVKRKLNLDKVTPGGEKGLSFLVKQCFGKPLDKTYQISNWEQRPLSQLQIRYAALDAFCLIEIYDLFEKLAEEFQIIISPNRSSDICNSSTGSCNAITEECVVSGLPRPPNQLKVVCDTMLQGLGKPLRSCGVDTITLQNGERHMKAVELSLEENRVILTAGKPFYQMRGCVPPEMCMSVPVSCVEDQLSAIFKRYNIRVTAKDLFSRCQVCNCGVFVHIKKEHMLLAYWMKNNIRPKEEFMTKHGLHHLRGSSRNDTGIDFKYLTLASGSYLKCESIPFPVFDAVDIFFVCSACGKVYWQGSHFDKVVDQFSNLIVDSDTDDL